jgi:hypothetical protein
VAPRPTWPAADTCGGEAAQPVVGAWHGYLEAQRAPWDHILLDIRGVDYFGKICGTITMGTQPPPPPATDPNVGYPPGMNLLIATAFTSPIVEGVAYALLDGTLEDGRARFSIGTNQPWRGWCALQTPIPNPKLHAYTCLPPYGGASVNPNTSECRISVDGAAQLIDCGKYMLCGVGGACSCDSEACDANPDTRAPFDLHFDAASADGAGPDGARARFFRAE